MNTKKQKAVVLQGEGVRVVARRDSAVTILRKLGTPPDMYKDFVSELTDGRWAAQVGRAKDYLEQRKDLAAERNAIKAKNATASAKRGERKAPISQTCLTLFREGKHNGEVWEHIKAKYELDDEKRGYPAWYRSYFRRRGDLPAVGSRHAH